MNIEIKEVKNKKDLKAFIMTPFKIYKDDKKWIPPLLMDEYEVFNPKKNPAFENAKGILFIAYKDNKIAGRIAGIISMIANDKYKSKNLRFGWYDSINDQSVSDALFDAVEQWGTNEGMESFTGPLGFTDLDPEGLMVEGFEEIPTVASNYNKDYYKTLIENYGFKKEIDYIEFFAKIPEMDEIPEKLLKISDRIKERGNLSIKTFKTKKELVKRGKELFTLLDEAFDEIYGSTPLTDKQIIYYTNKYLPFVHKDLIKIIDNEDGVMVGFMISMPSLTKGVKDANGRLFPFGWIHMLKALKTYSHLDFYLAGVKKKYRGMGVDLLMVIEIIKSAKKLGFKYCESNMELETNTKIHGLWKYFSPRQHKRRRIFKKNIGEK